MTVNWQLFRKWEIKEKKKRLRDLSPQKAFAVFEELYLLQASLPKEGLEKTHGRRLEYLVGWRKKVDSLKGELK